MPQQATLEWWSLREWYCQEFFYRSRRLGRDNVLARISGPYMVANLLKCLLLKSIQGLEDFVDVCARSGCAASSAAPAVR